MRRYDPAGGAGAGLGRTGGGERAWMRTGPVVAMQADRSGCGAPPAVRTSGAAHEALHLLAQFGRLARADRSQPQRPALQLRNRPPRPWRAAVAILSERQSE